MNKPINLDYEKMVLGGMMNNDNCFYKAIGEISEEYFTDQMMKVVFNRMIANQTRQTANMLIKSTKDNKEKSTIKILDGAWNNYEEFNFALIGLKDIYNKRQLYYTIEKAQKRFNEAKTDELASSMIDEISNIFIEEDNDDNIVDPKERAPEALSDFWKRVENPELAKGIPFSVTNSKGNSLGFPSLDKTFYGAHGGDLIMIAAETGKGKTGFAINLARLFSFTQKYHGYYMNTEMRLEEMESRLLAPIANVKANEILHGTIEGTDYERQAKISRISDAYNQYMQSNLYLSRIPDLPLHKAQGLAKQLKSQYKKLDYLIVDYVGRMEVKNFDGSSWDELYHITKQLKELAITLDIPIFLLAQRNQAGDVEGAKKMRNECDGVLYFEPTSDDDQTYIEQHVKRELQDLVNYKIIKNKVRRDDNASPIYVMYDKSKNFINEVV